MARRRALLAAAAVAPAAALLQACGGGGGSTTTTGGGGGGGGGGTGSTTLLALLQADGNFSRLVEAAQKAGLTGTLDTTTPLTLFAPNNAAFDAMGSLLGFGDGAGLIAALSDTQWASILRFHLVPQSLDLATLNVYGRSGGTRPDTLYSFENWPNARQLIFDTSLGALNIWDGCGRTKIEVTSGDIAASNGIMHVVDTVLVPRGVLTVLQMVRANIDYFSEFASSAVASSAANALNGSATCTVFVPVNGKGAGGLNSAQVGRHVVTGQRLDSDNFTNNQSLTPLSGSALRLSVVGTNRVSSLYNGSTLLANIIDVDFWASNGVIHVVDAVVA